MSANKLPGGALAARTALLTALLVSQVLISSLARKDEGKSSPQKAQTQTQPSDDFPLTNLKLETKPVNRWAFGFEPLNEESVLRAPFVYLSLLEKNMAKRDLEQGLKPEDDKRFEATLQFFVQKLLAKNRTKDAVKLEHRLARIQAKHPEFHEQIR